MQPVTIYTTDNCGYCRRAKELLTAQGVPFSELNVTNDDEERDRLVERSNGQRTVPQIFIGAHHVGGYQDLVALHQAGKLAALLTPEGHA